MVLVDTSVWIDHFRRGNATLQARLLAAEIMTHEHIIGELACGNLRRRTETLGWLELLPRAPVAEAGEVLLLIDQERLAGKGLGWIDAHLLASARLSGWQLWTLDRRLREVAARLHVGIG